MSVIIKGGTVVNSDHSFRAQAELQGSNGGLQLMGDTVREIGLPPIQVNRFDVRAR